MNNEYEKEVVLKLTEAIERIVAGEKCYRFSSDMTEEEFDKKWNELFGE